MVQWRMAPGKNHLCFQWCRFHTNTVCGVQCTCVCVCVPSLTTPVPKSKYPSFFSLLKHSFDALNDRKGEISKVSCGLCLSVCVCVCVFFLKTFAPYMYM